MPKEIHSSIPVSIPEVRELLLARKKEVEKEQEELSYMQMVALDHAILISQISAENARNLVENLMTTFNISDKGAITLANYMPDTIDEVRALLDPESKTMETETLEKILEMLNAVPRLEKKGLIDDHVAEDEYDEFDDFGKEIPEEIPEGLEDLKD
ncbi:MAG: hypothetical protein D6732_26945 [Methanobacteriota archaeon]|nr:MAG: hypothetical protein D6732_26945 [Euryarchaeota archaeon]